MLNGMNDQTNEQKHYPKPRVEVEGDAFPYISVTLNLTQEIIDKNAQHY